MLQYKKPPDFLSSILHTGPLNSVFCQELSLRQHAMQIKCTNLVWLRKTHAIFLHAASVLHIRPSALLARFFWLTALNQRCNSITKCLSTHSCVELESKVSYRSKVMKCVPSITYFRALQLKINWCELNSGTQ